jgi:hypothetical protein
MLQNVASSYFSCLAKQIFLIPSDHFPSAYPVLLISKLGTLSGHISVRQLPTIENKTTCPYRIWKSAS